MAMTEKDESAINPLRDLWIIIFSLIVLGVLWYARGGPDNPPEGPFLGVKPNPDAHFEFFEQSFSDLEKKNDIFLRVTGKYLEIELSEEGRRRSIKDWSLEKWSLAGEVSYKVPFPGAAGLFYMGEVNEEGDIILNPGDRVFIIAEASPVGANFRVNKCMGYLSQFQEFLPDFPKVCPLPREEDWPFFISSECSDYIETIPRCQAPLSIPAHLDNKCAGTISEKLNYNNCVGEHKKDKDFYLPEWRIYLEDDSLWEKSGRTIVLKNEDGEAMSKITY